MQENARSKYHGLNLVLDSDRPITYKVACNSETHYILKFIKFTNLKRIFRFLYMVYFYIMLEVGNIYMQNF